MLGGHDLDLSVRVGDPGSGLQSVRGWGLGFTQMSRRQNFDATPGADWTLFLPSPLDTQRPKKSACVKTPLDPWGSGVHPRDKAASLSFNAQSQIQQKSETPVHAFNLRNLDGAFVPKSRVT